MINPGEIKQYALKWWTPFLQSEVRGSVFFPKQINRIGKVSPGHITDRFQQLQEEIENLYKSSKNQTGVGYLVESASRNFRRTGEHNLPESIVFETAEDYVHVIGREKEWKCVLKNSAIIKLKLPQLREWIYPNVDLLAAERNWEDILKVCKYFLGHPRPELYIRQLPIAVHTKFIEENEFVLRSLLDFLIPSHVRDASTSNFSRRYYLKTDEPLIRVRLLDRGHAINSVTDLSIRLSDFISFPFHCRNILIAENKMNFLALPELADTMAIWSGGGFNVSYLKGVEWMSEKQIFYWGDLDIQGFHILHQMRGYFPQTKSVMMDMATFHRFKSEATQGRPGNISNLTLLAGFESELFDLLKNKNLRLEQEKITQGYVNEVLSLYIA